MDIGSFVEHYLKTRKMSLVEFSRMLGYRSKTSVVRLVKKETNMKSVERFAESLRKNAGLTEEELRIVEESVEELRWQENYRLTQEMLIFLKGKRRNEGEIILESTSGSEQLFSKRYADAQDIRFTLLNCPEVPVFEELRRLIVEQGARVEHLMMTDENNARTMYALGMLSPVVYLKNYCGYMANRGSDTCHQGVKNSDILYASYLQEGRRREDLIVFSEPCRGKLISGEGEWILRDLILFDRSDYVPILREFSNGESKEDYIQFSRECALLEHNRSVMAIRADFGIEFVPTDILVSAAMEGAFPDELKNGPQMERLIQIFDGRYCNNRDKKKHSYLVVSKNGMRSFAETGRTSDHFWGMRPFTLQERVRILKELLNRAENNPYFHLYFEKEDAFGEIMIYYFDGKGIMIAAPDTDYDLSGDHGEILIVHPEIMRVYKEYFTGKILQKFVLPAGEEKSYLRGLLEYCEEQAKA